MAISIIGPKFYAWDDSGKPLAFGKVYFYETDSSVPKATFTSESGLVENTNPVILNSEGYAEIYLDGTYKVIVTDQDDVTIWTEDPVSSPDRTGIPDWDGAETYAVGVTVFYDERIWQCLIEHASQEPTDDSSYWSIIPNLEVIQSSFSGDFATVDDRLDAIEADILEITDKDVDQDARLDAVESIIDSDDSILSRITTLETEVSAIKADALRQPGDFKVAGGRNAFIYDGVSLGYQFAHIFGISAYNGGYRFAFTIQYVSSVIRIYKNDVILGTYTTSQADGVDFTGFVKGDEIKIIATTNNTDAEYVGFIDWWIGCDAVGVLPMTSSTNNAEAPVSP